MTRFLRHRARGQSSVEFAMIFTMVALAVVAMFGFVRNAVSHRFKGGADTYGRGLLY